MTARQRCTACNTTPEVCDDQWTDTGLACCTTCDLGEGVTHVPDNCHRELDAGVCQTCGVVVGGAT